MVQCQDQQPQVESEQPQDTGPAAKVARPSEVVQGPSEADKYKANRRKITKTWRNSKILHFTCRACPTTLTTRRRSS